MIPSVQYPVLKVPACGDGPAARSSAFVLGARLNNTRLPGPCPELFHLRRHLHILHTYGGFGGSGARCGPLVDRRGSGAFLPNMSRALSRDKFGQTPCFSGPGLIIWPASLPRWTCLDRRASSQSNIRGFAGRAAAASDRRGSPPRALYVAGVASQFVATAGGVTFGLKSLPAGVPREQRPRE